MPFNPYAQEIEVGPSALGGTKLDQQVNDLNSNYLGGKVPNLRLTTVHNILSSKLQ
jgi:hypothetical protein